jgi:hypothetical protein
LQYLQVWEGKKVEYYYVPTQNTVTKVSYANFLHVGKQKMLFSAFPNQFFDLLLERWIEKT